MNGSALKTAEEPDPESIIPNTHEVNGLGEASYLRLLFELDKAFRGALAKPMMQKVLLWIAAVLIVLMLVKWAIAPAVIQFLTVTFPSIVDAFRTSLKAFQPG